MADSSIRRKRIGSTVRNHLSLELAREVADPRLALVFIQAVEVSPDLTRALVKIRLMGEQDQSGNLQAQVMQALHRLAPGLRSSLAPILRMRRVPDLRFEYDFGPDQRAQIKNVLDEIKKEDAEKRRALGIEDDPDEAEES